MDHYQLRMRAGWPWQRWRRNNDIILILKNRDSLESSRFYPPLLPSLAFVFFLRWHVLSYRLILPLLANYHDLITTLLTQERKINCSALLSISGKSSVNTEYRFTWVNWIFSCYQQVIITIEGLPISSSLYIRIFTLLSPCSAELDSPIWVAPKDSLIKAL